MPRRQMLRISSLNMAYHVLAQQHDYKKRVAQTMRLLNVFHVLVLLLCKLVCQHLIERHYKKQLLIIVLRVDA